MPRILPFLLLGCLLFLSIQAETVHAREASPLEFALGQALRPLISQDPTQLSDPSLLKAAEAALLAERPLLAEWILHSVKDEAGGPLIDYLQFEVFRQLGDTQAAYEMLDAHLGTWPPEKFVGEDWDARIGRLSDWLLERGDLEVGWPWIAALKERAPASSQMIKHWLRWLAFKDGHEAVRRKLAAFDREHDPALLRVLAEVSADVGCIDLSVAYTLRLWRLSENENDWAAAYALFARNASNGLRDNVLADLIARQPGLKFWMDFKLADYADPDVLAESIADHPVVSEVDAWRRSALLWRFGKRGRATIDLPPKEDVTADAENSRVLLDTLLPRLDERKDVSDTDRADWMARVVRVWTQLAEADPSPEAAALRLLQAPADPDKALRALIDGDLATMSKAQTLMAALLEISVLTRLGETQMAATRLSFALDRADAAKQRVLLEEVAALARAGNGQAEGPLKNLAIEQLRKRETQKAESEPDLRTFLLHEGLKHRFDMNPFHAAANAGKLSTVVYLDLLRRCYDTFGERACFPRDTALPTPDSLTDRLRLLELLFRLDRHENALAIMHKIENEAAASGPLNLAQRLLPAYLDFRDGLAYVNRRRRISLDIHTQLILRLLRRHVDEQRAASDWGRVFDILNRMQGDVMRDEAAAQRQRREALWEIDRDLDAAVFDFTQLYTAFGPQSADLNVRVMAGLAANTNPDFFKIFWGQVGRSLTNVSDLSHLAFILVRREDNALQRSFDEVLARWRRGLDAEDKPLQFQEAAWRLLAISDRQKTAVQRRNEKSKEYRRAFDKTITALVERREKLLDYAKLPFKRLALSYAPTPDIHGLSADVIATEFINNAWVIEDCLIESVEKATPFRFALEITVSQTGTVQRVAFRNRPVLSHETRTCIETRLMGFAFEPPDPPFGYTVIEATAEPTAPEGWRTREIEARKAWISRVISGLKARSVFLEKQAEQRLERVQALQDLAGQFMRLGYRIAYDSARYREAAWYMGHVERDAASAGHVENEGRWMMAWQIGWKIGILFLAGWLVVRVRRKRRKA